MSSTLGSCSNKTAAITSWLTPSAAAQRTSFGCSFKPKQLVMGRKIYHSLNSLRSPEVLNCVFLARAILPFRVPVRRAVWPGALAAQRWPASFPLPALRVSPAGAAMVLDRLRALVLWPRPPRRSLRLFRSRRCLPIQKARNRHRQLFSCSSLCLTNPQTEYAPAPRNINTNIPPAIARSFSKCSSSFRLAKFA
jgi:hypothetical protein